MSENIAHKIGDVVILKSEGHKMTVASIDDNSVTCDRSVRGDIKSKSFAAAQLTTDLPVNISLEQLLLGVEKLQRLIC
jgi:uncharacterized protein YodC (DUF2158 family)